MPEYLPPLLTARALSQIVGCCNSSKSSSRICQRLSSTYLPFALPAPDRTQRREIDTGPQPLLANCDASPPIVARHPPIEAITARLSSAHIYRYTHMARRQWRSRIEPYLSSRSLALSLSLPRSPYHACFAPSFAPYFISSFQHLTTKSLL